MLVLRCPSCETAVTVKVCVPTVVVLIGCPAGTVRQSYCEGEIEDERREIGSEGVSQAPLTRRRDFSLPHPNLAGLP